MSLDEMFVYGKFVHDLLIQKKFFSELLAAQLHRDLNLII